MTHLPWEREYWREVFRRLLVLFTDHQLSVAALRLEAVPDEGIARMLDISKQAVRGRIVRAERRIVRELPEMAGFFRDRVMRTGPRANRPIPLEQGWLCSDPVALRDYHPIPPVYSPSQVAALCEVSVRLIRAWCRTGKLPGAYKRHGRWLIRDEGLQVAREEARRMRGERSR